MRISDSKFGVLLTLPGLSLLILLVVVPSILLFGGSFWEWHYADPNVFNGFENYNKVFSDRLFWLSLRLVVIFCVGTTLLTFCTGLFLASCLSRIVRGSYVFRTLMMLPWSTPVVIAGFIWGWIFAPDFGVVSDLCMRLGLTSAPLNIYANPHLAMLGVIIAYSWNLTPFMTITLLAGLESIPQDLYEAARVDGADIIDTFRHISLPLIKRAALVGLLITSMFSFRTIDIIVSMTGGGPARATYVFGYYIYDLIWKSIRWGLSGAASVIMFLMISAFGAVYVYYIFKR